MRCPACGAHDTRVVDSRVAGPEQEQIRRRRECRECRARFTTFERAEFSLPRVVKRSGERVAFDEDKLRSGLRRADPRRHPDAPALIQRIAAPPIRNRAIMCLRLPC